MQTLMAGARPPLSIHQAMKDMPDLRVRNLLVVALALLAAPPAFAKEAAQHATPTRPNLKYAPAQLNWAKGTANGEDGPSVRGNAPTERQRVLDKIFAGTKDGNGSDRNRSADDSIRWFESWNDLSEEPDCPTPKMVTDRAKDKKTHYNYPDCPKWRLPAAAR